MLVFETTVFTIFEINNNYCNAVTKILPPTNLERTDTVYTYVHICLQPFMKELFIFSFMF